VAELAELAPVIAKLVAAGVTMEQPGWSAPTVEAGTGAPQAGTDTPQAGPLTGKTVVVTGAMTGPLAGLSRTEMTELIVKAGGKASSSISARTHLLVAGDAAGSKLDKARTLGIEIITPDDLAAQLSEYLA
jgi:DNA ligase (NAD+)